VAPLIVLLRHVSAEKGGKGLVPVVAMFLDIDFLVQGVVLETLLHVDCSLL